MNIVEIGGISIGAGCPLVLIAGPCVIEGEDVAMRMAEKIRKTADELGMKVIYKSSYLKDNRSSASSYQGPGLDEGLRILGKVRSEFGMPVLSDVHGVHEVEQAAGTLDVLQIPAYLSMQTSLVLAAGKTGKVINIKKGQFLHPADMRHAVGKLEEIGHRKILLTERGSCFGYRNLVVDFRSLPIMRGLGYPVVFDPTHTVRNYGISSGDKKGGDPEYIPYLTRAGAAVGIDALFIETHDDCDNAKCDAASMLRFEKLKPLLAEVLEIDAVVRKRN